jgi:hypothetical protein
MLLALRGIDGPTSSSKRPCVVLHDPGAERPHDLDDPFFEREVQERIGGMIASAAQAGGKARTGGS